MTADEPRPSSAPGERLERALAAFLGDTPGSTVDAGELLAQHGELRDLLEPMLGGSARAVVDDTDERLLGDFRLQKELGRGGMGIVFEAWQRSLDRKVAVKVLAPALVASPTAVARFRREAAAAGRLRHPHIVEVHGFGSDGERSWFAMQLVEGEPLHRVAARLATPAAVVELLLQIGSALEHAHAAGLVHRDVKPANVLVRADGHALLTDFGIASDEALPSLTLEGGFLGTLDYASPEQVRGERVDARTDLWALGVLACELLAGSHPFRAATQAATMQAVLSAPTPVLAGVRGVSRDLAAIVDRLLEKDMRRRYASATALLADLRAWRDGRPVSVRLPTAGERVLRWARREPWRAAALLVLSAGLCASTVGFWLANQRAVENADLASRERQAASDLATKVREFDLLAGVTLRQRAIERADQLHPAVPANAAALRAWLQDEAAMLLAMRPRLQAAIAQLQTRATEPAAQFLRQTLQQLDDELAGPFVALREAVARRLRWAERIGELTVAHPLARVTWAAARAAIAAADDVVASASYRDVALSLTDAEVIGLVPIGMNPVTKLWEFYDLRSAWDGEVDPASLPIPTHQPDGSIAMDQDVGIVFVLLPGGACSIGAQGSDPAAPNHDPEALAFMGPVQSVTLWPFLIARHEITQAQWARLCEGHDGDRHPSGHPAGNNDFAGHVVTWWNPVEKVSWNAAERVLRQQGLELPTEAQWEYACRGGTSTPYWAGATSEHLEGCANVHDLSGARSQPNWGPGEPFDDGYVVHAPVGTFAANPFGLFDMHGNVSEWCRDLTCTNRGGFRDGDGARASHDRDDRSLRGGSYTVVGQRGRAALWGYGPPDYRAFDTGVRAARRLRQP
ncbi:MAG: SUMF1/EgtB/PvdO family nonheme iron enzyme [Planctomycetes bacterium]|nr:SUMF1/EgtB/PvdO family nonheme iron enzyme [Planctomycetota bacterium]